LVVTNLGYSVPVNERGDSALSGLIRQPLVWFALIGIALFVADSRFSVGRSEIYVSTGLQDRLAALWTTQTGLIATEAELDSLLQNWIRDEVLYQEALRLGLDQEDSIVRRRLVQKLSFIAETEQTLAPEIATLETFYRNNIDDYTLPKRYSFRQLYFESLGSAEQALRDIGLGHDTSGLGDPTMLNASYAYRSAIDLNATFGFGFPDQLQGLEIAKWQGPIRSGFGYHLIQTTSVEPEQTSPFATVQQQVAIDYRQYQQENARDAFVINLMDQYTIVVEQR
jgi:hypothetical protein